MWIKLRKLKEITYIDVDEYGVVKLPQLIESIRYDTILISVMMANNEIGTIQPIAQIGEIANRFHIPFHTDAVQAYGHIPINVNSQKIDLMSASAHKFNGPKGVGFLYIRDNIDKSPLIFGGGQESGFRAGTQNVPSIVGMSKAASIAHENLLAKLQNKKQLRDYMVNRILSEIPYSRLNGEYSNRLPENANFSFQFIESSELLALLDLKGICGSSASACSSDSKEPSHVLKAIGLPDELAYGSLRLTISEETTKEEIDFVVETIKEIINDLRNHSSDFQHYFENRKNSDIIY